MQTPIQQELARSLQWGPWPVWDPAPEIWRIIDALDQRIQLQVADAVLSSQIQILQANAQGLENIRKAIGGTTKRSR